MYFRESSVPSGARGITFETWLGKGQQEEDVSRETPRVMTEATLAWLNQETCTKNDEVFLKQTYRKEWVNYQVYTVHTDREFPPPGKFESKVEYWELNHIQAESAAALQFPVTSIFRICRVPWYEATAPIYLGSSFDHLPFDVVPCNRVCMLSLTLSVRSACCLSSLECCRFWSLSPVEVWHSRHVMIDMYLSLSLYTYICTYMSVCICIYIYIYMAACQTCNNIFYL